MRGLTLVLFAVFLSGCAVFAIETPPELIDFNSENRFEHVAMTHDGVVLRVKVHRQGEGVREVPRGDLTFWTNATRERMRTAGGYALVEESEVQSKNGVAGKRLEFGRDQGNRPYRYVVVLFVTEDHIHVIDAGGRVERFDGASDAVDAAIRSYEVLR